jgi:hypothetical protein
LPVAEQTTFEVVYLTSVELANLRDNLYGEAGSGKKRKVEMKTGTFSLKILQKGLRGWRNLVGDDGKAIPFDSGRVGEMIDYINPEVQAELSGHIQGAGEETED